MANYVIETYILERKSDRLAGWFNNNMKEDIRNIQIKCIEILDIVDEICRKYHIEYSLCGWKCCRSSLISGMFTLG